MKKIKDEKKGKETTLLTPTINETIKTGGKENEMIYTHVKKVLIFIKV